MKHLYNAILEGNTEQIDKYINELSKKESNVIDFFKIDVKDGKNPKFVEHVASNAFDQSKSQLIYRPFEDPATLINPSKTKLVPNMLMLDAFSLAYLYNRKSFMHLLAHHPHLIHHFKGAYKPMVVDSNEYYSNQILAVYPPNQENIIPNHQKHAITFTGQFDCFNDNFELNLRYYKQFGFNPLADRYQTTSLPIPPADQMCKWISLAKSTDSKLRENIFTCLVEGLLTTLTCTLEENTYLENLYLANISVFKMLIQKLIIRLQTKPIDNSTLLVVDASISKLFGDGCSDSSALATNKLLMGLWADYYQSRQDAALKPKNKEAQEKPLSELVSAFLYESGIIPTPLTKEMYAAGLAKDHECGTQREGNTISFTDEDIKKIPPAEWQLMDDHIPEEGLGSALMSLIVPGEDYLENLANIFLNKERTRLLYTIRDNSQTPTALRKAIDAAANDTTAFLIISIRLQQEQKVATTDKVVDSATPIPTPGITSIFAPAPVENLDEVSSGHWLKS